MPLVDNLDEVNSLIQGPARAVVIAERDVNLQDLGTQNRLFILVLAEGSLAAGGRGGGFGERRVVKVAMFKSGGGACKKLFETTEQFRVSEFEVPFHVARMPMTLKDGTVSMGYGVVDPELVAEFSSKAGSPV